MFSRLVRKKYSNVRIQNAAFRLRSELSGLSRLIVSVTLASLIAQAEQLPIRRYTTTDGLARNEVNRIVRDSGGYLWFCTSEGLSRFDGSRFVNYSNDDGLPSAIVLDLLETRSGIYLIGTAGGICRFDPEGAPLHPGAIESYSSADPQWRRGRRGPLFHGYPPVGASGARSVRRILEDRTGTVWCGTGSGLVRLVSAKAGYSLSPVDLGMPRDTESDLIVHDLMEDRSGALWIGAGSGLYRRWPDGRTERFTTRQGLPVNEVRALAELQDGSLWAGTRQGLCQLVSHPGVDRTIVNHVYTKLDGLGTGNIMSLFQSSNGRFWVGSPGAFDELSRRTGNHGRQAIEFHGQSLLPHLWVNCIAEDADRNIWVGSDMGALRLAAGGFTTYAVADGLASPVVVSIFPILTGQLCASTRPVQGRFLSQFDGHGFTTVRPKMPASVIDPSWAAGQQTLQDRTGEWWVPMLQGLARYPASANLEFLSRTAPRAVYSPSDGLPSGEVLHLYEDHRGDIWISTFSEERNRITRWSRSDARFRIYSEVEGVPADLPIISSFAEDQAGDLWVGCEGQRLGRFHSGVFTFYGPSDGVPGQDILSLYPDTRGRLWIGTTTSGASRLDNPSLSPLRFINYSSAQGLSSNYVSSITQDRWDRIYLGTGRGVDRLDPETGRVKNFTEADGLAGGNILASFRDSNDTLWFGTSLGLSRLVPQIETAPKPPPILISGLRIANMTLPVSELGVQAIGGLELDAGENNLSIQFVSPNFQPGAAIRFQYQLEGPDSSWSRPTAERTVHYASLRPGSYRFKVQALNSEAAASPEPAIVSFVILHPIWQRWWFLSLIVCLLGSLVYLLHRRRVARLLEIQSVRMRIATDLHDDIGSNLTQIAILSEVLSRQVGEAVPEALQPLSVIAGISRELVDSMSDIVWAINPEKDQLRDLTQRMRQFAGNLLTARNIALQFQPPTEGQDVKIGSDLRRQVYLIFKESLHNVVRHSGCTEVRIVFEMESGQISLRVTDNGKGLPEGEMEDGQGIPSMHRRASRIGGKLELLSDNGRGTTLMLRVPLAARSRESVA